MTVDWTDALVFVGLAVMAVGLYLVQWPLVLVLVGAAAAAIGFRRSA